MHDRRRAPPIRAALPSHHPRKWLRRLQTVSAKDNCRIPRTPESGRQVTGPEWSETRAQRKGASPLVNTPTRRIDTFLSTGIEFCF